MQTDVYSLGATRFAVGLSTITKVTAGAFQSGDVLKILSGGGTLEIIPIPVALSGSSAAGWGLGYPIGINEVINVGGPATFYLAASGGATMVASMYFSYSATGPSLV